MRGLKLNQKTAYPALLALLALAVFQLKFGLGIANPFRSDWLQSLGSDRATEYLCWLYFRASHSSWLPATLTGYYDPAVTGIGMTGAIPLLAIPAKILYRLSGWDFQYFGAWMLACYLLSAWFGFKLIQTLTPDRDHLAWLGAAFFLFSPPLLTRSDHMNLCAHWILLAGLYLYYCQPRVPHRSWYGLLGITACVHQYLTMMALALFAAALLRRRGEDGGSWSLALTRFLVGFAVVFLCWWACGNFVQDITYPLEGFGRYSSNLNTFWNSQGLSSFLPAFPNYGNGQYEGYAYLGLGGLLLVLGGFFLQKLQRADAWILGVAILCFLFALSTVISWQDRVLLDIKLPNFLWELSANLRASGRFSWILYYLLLFLGLKAWIQFPGINLPLKSVVLGAFLVLQVMDTYPAYTRPDYKRFTYDINWDQGVWDMLLQGTKKVITYPLYEKQYNFEGDYFYFAEMAARKGIPVTTGYLSREPVQIRDRERQRMDSLLAAGAWDPQEELVIIVAKNSIDRFGRSLQAGTLIPFLVNDYLVLVPRSRMDILDGFRQRNWGPARLPESLPAFLRRNRDQVILVSARDEASRQLCEDAKASLDSLGSRIRRISYRDSYIAVIAFGKVRYESFSQDRQSLTAADFSTLDPTFRTWKVELLSAGMASGDRSSILVQGAERSVNLRGLNLVVLNRSGQVLESVNYDTFQSCYSRQP